MSILRDAKTKKLNMLGFTLFTAMVSFIVIGIGVVVIQHMINSEQNYSQIISSLLNQQEMDSTKDIIRLDALQVFNLVYRAKFFEYFDANFSPEQSNDDYIDVGLGKDWPTFQNNFTCEMFFGGNCDGTKFSVFVANKIIGLLYEYSGYFKGSTYWFRIYDYSWQKTNPLDITSPTTTPSITQTQFTNALSEGLLGAKDAGKFMQLILCDKTDQAKCENGSFYTNIDLYSISPELYLNLPRVFLKRAYDDSSVDDAILPNNIISFFIPMRLYGALAFTRNTLQNFDFEQYKDEWFGDDVGNVSCSFFSGKEYAVLEQSLKPKDQFTLQTELKDKISNSLSNVTENEFILNVSDVAIEDSFDAKTFTLNVTSNGMPQPAITLIEKRVSLLRVKVNVVDNNPFYSFGHASTMVFKLTGAKEVQGESTEAISCSCEIDPDSKLLNCQ